jgi:galactose oxidase
MMRQLYLTPLFFVATAFATTITLAPSSRADVVRTGYTTLTVASTGKCLDIGGASAAAGAAANQWHCNFNPNEQWTVQPFNGAFRVLVQHSGQCLTPADASGGVNSPVVQNPCTGQAAERWTFQPVAGGYQLVSAASGKCASVVGNSLADNAAIVLDNCSSAANFVWSFSGGLVRPSDLVDIQAQHSGQCLNVNGNSTAVGAGIIQWPCSGGDNEQWTLVPAAGAYQVVSKRSGLCVAVAGASTSPSANIIQTTCSSATDRLFNLRAVGHAYQLVAQNSGLCLNVSGNNQTAGAGVIQSTCSNNAANGLFALSAASIPATWSGLINVAVNPIAVANLPSGKLVMWSANNQFSFEGDIGSASGRTYTSLFDPATNSSTAIVVTNTGADMFCPGTANLFDGKILVNGGSSSPKTSLYDPASAGWSVEASMSIPRGYQGDTVLSDGSVLTLGGSWSGGYGGKLGEVWTAGAGWRRLWSVSADPVTGPDPQGVFRGDNHLWLFTAGNGKVFHAGPSAAMHWITTAGNGTISDAGNRADDPYSINGNAVLYDAAGLIVKMGGAPAYQNANATSSSYVIDIKGASPVVTKIAPMAYKRAFANAVVLPNGQVVVIGGQTYPVPFSDDTSVLIPELWDPDTRVFRQLKAMQTPRNYHSTAILLPDGRVFEGGGGQCGDGCVGNHLNAEILTPPYLLNADGSLASRPTITQAPATATLGSSIVVTTGGPVVSFSMIRLSSVTHTVNNDQRRVPLAIQATSGANSYTLGIPSNPSIVLRGYYMLFALNAQGVPSLAATIRVN